MDKKVALYRGLTFFMLGKNKSADFQEIKVHLIFVNSEPPYLILIYAMRGLIYFRMIHFNIIQTSKSKSSNFLNSLTFKKLVDFTTCLFEFCV